MTKRETPPMTAAVRRRPARPKPRTRKEPTPKVTIPEPAENRAARALANLNAAEAKRPQKLPSNVTNLVPSSAPSKRRSKTTDPVASEFNLDAAVQAMSVEFLQCRDYGHSWRPHTARWVSSSNAYESVLRCARCLTLRTRWLSRTGAQIGGQYDYAEGYLQKGMGRLTGTDRDKIRLQSILTVLNSEPDHSA